MVICQSGNEGPDATKSPGERRSSAVGEGRRAGELLGDRHGRRRQRERSDFAGNDPGTDEDQQFHPLGKPLFGLEKHA